MQSRLNRRGKGLGRHSARFGINIYAGTKHGNINLEELYTCDSIKIGMCGNVEPERIPLNVIIQNPDVLVNISEFNKRCISIVVLRCVEF
jgi:hypothetical protein